MDLPPALQTSTDGSNEESDPWFAGCHTLFYSRISLGRCAAGHACWNGALIAGGIGKDGQPLNKLGLWNPTTRATEPFGNILTTARRGHTAKLQAGNVRIGGGVTAAGTKPDQDETIEVGDSSGQTDAELEVAASIPANEATDVASSASCG